MPPNAWPRCPAITGGWASTPNRQSKSTRKPCLPSAGVSFARTHDLLQLLSALYPAVQFSNVELEAAATLIPFAVVWRYPQDSDPDELPVSQLLDFAYLLRERLRPLIVAALA